MIFVFDLGFSDLSGIEQAPINGLAPTIYVALLHKIQKRVGDGGFIVEAHCEIWIVPAAKHSKTFKIFLVLLNVTGGEIAAKLAKFSRGNFPFAAKFFFYLSFDRQPVAVPARNVRSVVAPHALGLDDQVLQDFVQAGAKMNRAGRVRRTVMQYKEWLTSPCVQNLLIEIGFLPSLELFRLIQGEACLHREFSFREIQGLLEVEWFRHGFRECNSLLSPSFRLWHGGKHRKVIELRMLQ